MAKRRKDPSKIADKQISRLSSAVPEIEDGIQAVTESPTAKAADNLDKAKARYVAAIDSGKTAKRLRAVSLQDWQEKTLAKVTRVAEGVEASRGKIERFHAQRNAAQDRIDATLKTMPTRTLDDSIRRMTTQVREMANFEFDPTK